MCESLAYKGYEITPVVSGLYDVIDIWEIIFSGTLAECKEFIDDKVEPNGGD